MNDTAAHGIIKQYNFQIGKSQTSKEAPRTGSTNQDPYPNVIQQGYGKILCRD
jgi:hypothetical protein